LGALRTPLQTQKICTNRGFFYRSVNSGGSIDWQRVDFGRVIRWDGKIMYENELTLLAELELGYGRERVQPFHELHRTPRHQTPRRSSPGARPQFSVFRAVGLGEGNLLTLFVFFPTNLLPMQLSEANEIHTESSIPSSHFFP